MRRENFEGSKLQNLEPGLTLLEVYQTTD